MKKFLANNLTLLGEIATIILSLNWYFQNREIEPIIALIVSSIAFITSLFFRVNSPKLILNIENLSKSRRQEAMSRSDRNARDKEGNIIIYQGGGTSVFHWELSWFYTLSIRNNSSHVVYSPIMFTKDNSPNINITQFLDEFEPIQPQEKIDIEIKYTIHFEGTGDEANNKLKEYGKYPPEMKKLQIMVSYKDEGDSNLFSVFSVSSNNTSIKGRSPKKFDKLVLYEIQKRRKK